VVREMSGDKASGPDGFSMAFFSEMLGGSQTRYYGGFLRIA
jgi:hypothetical protein